MSSISKLYHLLSDKFIVITSEVKAMRIYLFGFCIALCAAAVFAVDELNQERTLTMAVKEYESLQKNLDILLAAKSQTCNQLTTSDSKFSFCSLKDICANPQVQSDSPILYQNEKGESIFNTNYYLKRKQIKACLEEKYKDEIEEKREELTKKLGLESLRKIITATKKLAKLTAKFDQSYELQKISLEVLNMSLKSGLKGEPSDWTKNSPSLDDLKSYVAIAEKRTKIFLNPDIKKALVEIEYLKKNTTYTDEIQTFEKNLIPQVSIQDPLLDWKLLTDEKAAGGLKALMDNRKMFTEKTQNAYALFQETQKEMIEYLGSIKNPLNSEKIDRIITRITTIRFNPPRLSPTLILECKSPNAYYDTDTHSFTICPQMLNYPKMALVETIAHEITHSFDPCTMSGKFYQLKGPLVVEVAPFEVDIKMSPVLGNFKNTMEEDPYLPDLKKRQQDKLLYKDNPFAKTISCLQDPLSVGAQTIKLDEMRLKAKEKLAELTRLGQNTEKNPEARELNYFNEHEEDYFNYFQGCDASESGSLGNNQIQEAFADKISSEIVARKLNTLNREDAQKSFLEITLSYGNICANESQDVIKLREFAIKENCPKYSENMINQDRILKSLKIIKPDFDTHSESAKRIEKIHLAHPGIRKALKCTPHSEAKYCE